MWWPVVAGQMCLLQSSFLRSRTAGDLNPQQERALLDKHNEVRRLEGADGMRRLAWSAELAKAAQTWAEQCVYADPAEKGEDYPACSGGKCSSGHANLHANSMRPALFDLTQGVQSWWEEKRDWDFDDGTYDRGRCAPDRMCDHYTQVVWASSALVGCGIADCTDKLYVRGMNLRTLLVCEYSPGGNVPGELVYQRGKPCSACPGGSTCCEKGLCVGDLSGAEPGPLESRASCADDPLADRATLAPTPAPTTAPTTAPRQEEGERVMRHYREKLKELYHELKSGKNGLWAVWVYLVQLNKLNKEYGPHLRAHGYNTAWR